MKPKTIKIIYWVLTILLALAFAGDAFGGITKQQAGIDSLNQIGFPVYMMPFMGIAKLLGVIALLQTKYVNLKEWAFAGFAFIFAGATVARAATGGGAGMIAMPVVVLGLLLLTYFFWNKYHTVTIK